MGRPQAAWPHWGGAFRKFTVEIFSDEPASRGVGRQALVGWVLSFGYQNFGLRLSHFGEQRACFAGKCGFARGAFSFVTFLWAAKKSENTK